MSHWKGQADPDVIQELPHAWVRLGAAGKGASDLLRHEQVERGRVLAGAVRRPSLVELKPDFRTAKFAAKGVFSRGDDGLLAAVVKALEEEEGFRIVGAQDIMGGILVREGHLGQHQATDRIGGILSVASPS